MYGKIDTVPSPDHLTYIYIYVMVWLYYSRLDQNSTFSLGFREDGKAINIHITD